MSDLKMISPLLDSMVVEKEIAGHTGRSCYTLRNVTSGERFILKCMSVPASESQVNALIYSGAYPDEAAVHEYYGSVIEDMKAELNIGKKLAAGGSFAGALDYQIERKENGVGYDIYILYPLYISLSELMSKGAMTNLRAVNLGIDICDAISACREAGYLFGNIKPENIYLMQSGRFLLGDLGLVSLQDLKYACVPEEYICSYSAPELSDLTSELNTTVDLYSLGMVLHRIYNSNHSPFEDEETGEAMADKLRMTGKPLPTPLYADYELAGIILRACAFKPEARYQTPEELKQALVLYMQRNEISDALLVPPIVAPDVPPVQEEPGEETGEYPVRMTDAQTLDDDFRRSFAPDLSGAGTEKDIDKTIVMPAVVVPEAPEATGALIEEAPADEAPAAEEAVCENISASADDLADPDQIDIDELLASVEQVVGEATAETNIESDEASPLTIQMSSTPPADKYVDAAPEVQEAPQKPKVGPVIAKIAAIILLLAAIGAVAYFLLTWYYVDVSKLEVMSCTTEQAVVALSSEDELDSFVVSCSDNYGNAYPVSVRDGVYYVNGLQEQTIYTVTVNAAEYHALTAASTYTLNFTTPEATKVTEFHAARGDADGEVLLSFLYEGPEPHDWLLSYTNAAGDDAKEFIFDGNSFLVTGLRQNETYSFTLGTGEGFYPSGVLSVQYELLPIVEAKNLNIASIDGGAVTLTWEPGENLPEEWTVTCEAEGMETITQTARQTSCTLDLQSLDRDYTISVTARGMDKPESLSLPANPIVVSNLRSTVNEDGSIGIAWDTPAGVPSGGWYVSYNTVGSFHSPYFANGGEATGEENAVVLYNLIPNAEYEVSLTLTADDADEDVFGSTVLLFTTNENGVFDGYNLAPDAPLTAEDGNMQLYILPNLEEWDYTDLDNDDQKDVFAADEKIAVCIEVNSVRSSTDDVTLMYVIRNSEGKVVNDVFKTLEWSDMWYSRRHASAIPTPGKPGEPNAVGEYTLEVYVNGYLLATVSFSIQ